MCVLVILCDFGLKAAAMALKVRSGPVSPDGGFPTVAPWHQDTERGSRGPGVCPAHQGGQGEPGGRLTVCLNKVNTCAHTGTLTVCIWPCSTAPSSPSLPSPPGLFLPLAAAVSHYALSLITTNESQASIVFTSNTAPG